MGLKSGKPNKLLGPVQEAESEHGSCAEFKEILFIGMNALSLCVTLKEGTGGGQIRQHKEKGFTMLLVKP